MTWAKDLHRRLFVSLISIVVVIVLIVFSTHPVFRFVLIAFVACLAIVAIWEFVQMAKAKGVHILFPLIAVATFFEVISFYMASVSAVWHLLPFVIFFIALLCFFSFHFQKTKNALVDVSASIFGLLYVVIPLSMILSILYSPSCGYFEDGRWWMAYLLVVTKITDVGAYFGGKILGRKKLAHSISPHKTIEGAVLGFLCAVAASLCFYFFEDSICQGCFQFGLTQAIGLGAVLGIAGQLGDLSESLLKRDANIKDSNILPGLGGVLDAVDSLLFNIPIIYFFLCRT